MLRQPDRPLHAGRQEGDTGRARGVYRGPGLESRSPLLDIISGTHYEKTSNIKLTFNGSLGGCTLPRLRSRSLLSIISEMEGGPGSG